jgi:hypothetical protein
MCSKTVFQSAHRIPSGVLGVGVPLLLFLVVGAVLVASYLTPSGGPVQAADGRAAVETVRRSEFDRNIQGPTPGIARSLPQPRNAP